MPISVFLNEAEAACLDAMRTGAVRKTAIALRTGLNESQTYAALKGLTARGLVSSGAFRTWRIAEQAAAVVVTVKPSNWKRKPYRTKPPAAHTSAGRLLALLDRPQHGPDLKDLLGVSRQRVHQLIVALLGAGLIRAADLDSPTFAIARTGDRTLLLGYEQERILSALPDNGQTTPKQLASASQIAGTRVLEILKELCALGLAETAESMGKGITYRLTRIGRVHWQRKGAAPRAEPQPLPFRSARVQTVLSCLEQQGSIRTRDLAHGLGLPLQSVNALMQYLKRRQMVRQMGEQVRGYHELTDEGRRTLAAMRAEEYAEAA